LIILTILKLVSLLTQVARFKETEFVETPSTTAGLSWEKGGGPPAAYSECPVNVGAPDEEGKDLEMRWI